MRYHKFINSAFVLIAATSLATGCNTLNRLSEVGQAPKMTTIQNPIQSANYRAVSLPMPPPSTVAHKSNSLWRAGARAFFKDQRASAIGDILTVEISINDKAALSNTTTRDRATTEDAGVTSLLGLQASLHQIFPEAIVPSSLLDIDSTTSNSGKGTIDRDEEINLKIAAIITQTLPNGNLVIHGRQEVRVNYEVRELQIAGIIRPEDVTSSNTISYEKIAEARISYGGRGHISDFQQPRWGTQVIDVLFPF